VAAPIGWGQALRARQADIGAVRFGLRASASTSCAGKHVGSPDWHGPLPAGQHQAQTAGVWPIKAAAMSSAKSQWIRARGSHGMLGLDRSAGKRLEESDVPGDVNAQIEGNRLVQTVVCRG
jgi:hypothetical protein